MDNTPGFGSTAPAMRENFEDRVLILDVEGNPKDTNAKTVSIFRFAPQMLGQAGNPAGWRKRDFMHFGYGVPMSNDRAKTRQLTFRCVRSWGRSAGIIERECPEEIKVNQQKQLFLAAGGVIGNDGRPREPAETHQARPLYEWLRRHNSDTKFRLNGWNQEWKPARIRISKPNMVQIEDLMNQLGGPANALALDSGVWWKITRTGNGYGTPDKVDLLREGDGLQGPIKAAPVPASAREAALAKCIDVTDPHPGVVLTYDQVQAVVNAGEDPEAIEKIVGITNRVQVQAPAGFQRDPVGQVPANPQPAPGAATTQVFTGLPPGIGSNIQQNAQQGPPTTFRPPEQQDANATLERVTQTSAVPNASLSPEDIQRIIDGVKPK